MGRNCRVNQTFESTKDFSGEILGRQTPFSGIKEVSGMSGEERTNTVDSVDVEISVVIGKTRMPIHHLLRMGRGAVIELNSNENDEVEILANDFPVARGQVIVQGKRIQVEITSLIRRPEVERFLAGHAKAEAGAED
ncbi:MAG: flagellar motor switch protein [Beijerinckiaceae bacterium]|nr:MAG: flagellar motor switch protein [Beijerinckiaceae bacterium]